jgi:hypothetical protein
MNSNFEYTANLQYRVKSLSTQVEAFKSGEKYKALRAAFKTQLDGKAREIRGLKVELASARAETSVMRRNWEQVFEDIEKEHAKELSKKGRELKAMEERALRAERQRDECKDKNRDLLSELYRVKTELFEEQGKNLKLTAQVNRDFENSSVPSSLSPNHKKIPNSREKTGRTPGGQRGHEGHTRKKQTPTVRIPIPAPAEYEDNPLFKPTGNIVSKQVVNVKVSLEVTEYFTPEFRNTKTGQRVHAEFPEGMNEEVNYGGSVKALAFLLNNYCNVSIDKTRGLLSELTGGALEISKGMINGLCEEFSVKTEDERKKSWEELLTSPSMHTDGTGVRVNGKNMNVLVCVSGDNVLFFAREHKGHEGVKGTPVEKCVNVLIHDHDITFYSYGGGHQECLVHILRYLKDSIANEPGLTWNKMMHSLLREMIHCWKDLGRKAASDAEKEDDAPKPKVVPDTEKAEEFENRYNEILKIAEREYEYEPPTAYYKDGYNLYKRLGEFSESCLLFLHNAAVTPDNNLSERLLRKIKRKMRQIISWRSFKNLSFFCDCMGVIESLRARDENLYDTVTKAFI